MHRKVFDLVNNDAILWRDIIEGCPNLAAIFPKRPGEEDEVYDYRLSSFEPSLPIQYAQQQVIRALGNQHLTSHNTTIADVVSRETWRSFVRKLSESLVKQGSCYVVAVYQMTSEGQTTQPIIIEPHQVIAASTDELVWRDTVEDNLNLETGEREHLAHIYHYKEGQLTLWQAKLKRSEVSRLALNLTRGYIGKYMYRVDSEFAEQWSVANVPQPIYHQAYEQVPKSLQAYLKVKLSWLDTLNSSGYVQRVLKPHVPPNDLDLPMSVEEADTGNQFLIKADSFSFSEMSGTAAETLKSGLEFLALEQLQWFGLDLKNTVAQSGEAIQQDSHRFKQVSDNFGSQIRGLCQKILAAYGVSNLEDCQLSGLSDYQVKDIAGRIGKTKMFVELLTTADGVETRAVVSEAIKLISRDYFGDYSPETLLALENSVLVPKTNPELEIKEENNDE